MKEHIDVIERAGDILGALTPGALFTVCVDGEVNTMTIGWGMLGIEWRKPVFIAYIRNDRYRRARPYTRRGRAGGRSGYCRAAAHARVPHHLPSRSGHCAYA